MKTKKILVPIDLNKPEKSIKDFLYPDIENSPIELTGIKNEKIWKTGMIVLTSEITENEIFARIIENSNKKIKSVDYMLKSLVYYIDEIKKFKIGNIISITQSDNEFGFELTKIKERVSLTKKNKLP